MSIGNLEIVAMHRERSSPICEKLLSFLANGAIFVIQLALKK